MAESRVSEGVQAPDFTLPSTADGSFTLAEQRGRQNIVLFFYDRDGAGADIEQASAFRDASELFREQRAEVVGVGRGDLALHRRFVADSQLPFQLLVDEDDAVAALYGAVRSQKLLFFTRRVFRRSTFVIDRIGVVRRIFRDIDDAETHVNELLGFMDTNL